MEQENSKLGKKLWIAVIMFGLIGQVAWIVENMFFNLYIDRTMYLEPVINASGKVFNINGFSISIMVAASAIVATFATLIAGIWSDKIGKRKQIISIGYIVWGIIIMSFSFITVKNTEALFGIVDMRKATIFTIVIVIIMDCVMTYVGSTSNDACFNAWITDNTKPSNRGKVEGVLSIMPVIAMAIVFVVLGPIVEDKYQNPNDLTEVVNGWREGFIKIEQGNWTLFYCLLGGIVIFAGIIGLFLIKDNKNLKPSLDMSFKDIFYGAKRSVIKKNKCLYLTYLSMMLVGIANNCYIPYLIIYAERTLGYTSGSYAIPVGVIIVLSAIISVLFGIKMDKSTDRRKFYVPLLIIYELGAICMLIASPLCFPNSLKTPIFPLIIAGVLLIGANLCLAAVLVASVRDLTPTDKVGLFQGVRMFFWVLVPMVIGPMMTAITEAWLSVPSGAKDMYGNDIYNYSPWMFLLAAIVTALAFLPVLKLKKATLQEMRPYAEANANNETSMDISEVEQNDDEIKS
ncbi:MAG: MFS transporter [Clostridia bacterium]